MAAHRPLSVLVVDDNRDAANCLAELVRLLGHNADVAYGGAEALTMAALQPPDVARLDLLMPRTCGFEVARSPLGMRCRPLLVALTGHDGEDTRHLAVRAGFHLYLIKPADADMLRPILDGAREKTVKAGHDHRPVD